jgi:hypothetical protein
MRKIALLLVAMVLALGAMGAGYALWWKVLYINGTINTDNVDAEWYVFNNPDDCSAEHNDPIPQWEGGGRLDKDVGCTDVWIDSGDPQIIHVEIHNGYPCYYNDIELEFENTGSVPVKINGLTVIPENFTLSSAYGADDGEIWIDMIDGLGDQVDPGELKSFSFHIHVEQPAAELATYRFMAQVELVQWNEYFYDPDDDGVGGPYP